MIVSSIMKTNLNEPLMATSRMMGKYPTSTFPSEMESTILPSGSRGWKMAGSQVTMRAKALMSPLMLSICMCKLTQLGMARKTPSNHSLLGFMSSSLGLAATLCTCSMKLKTLMTGGWLERSPASMSSIKRPPNSPCELRSCMKSSMWPATPEPCQRNDWSSPTQPKRWPDLKTSWRRLAYYPHMLIARTTIDKNVSSNGRVMLSALRMPGGYRLPHLM